MPPDITGQDDLDPRTREAYRAALVALAEAGVPFLVGGGYAYAHYTGRAPHTKDVDLYVRPHDRNGAFQALAGAGFHVEGVFYWIGKAMRGDDCVDVICQTTNGLTTVDDEWFAHAPAAEALGLPIRLCPVEELIWSKAFLMERERYDGSDVAHLLLARGAELDWTRLLRRFDRHWRVLLSHLILFGFIYPGERERIPNHVMSDLLTCLQQERRTNGIRRPTSASARARCSPGANTSPTSKSAATPTRASPRAT